MLEDVIETQEGHMRIQHNGMPLTSKGLVAVSSKQEGKIPETTATTTVTLDTTMVKFVHLTQFRIVGGVPVRGCLEQIGLCEAVWIMLTDSRHCGLYHSLGRGS